ncbi:MAG TPA: S53 family peptidase, partial [Terriglobales bacterium]
MLCSIAALAVGPTAYAGVIQNQTPAFVRSSPDLGAVNPSSRMSVTLILKHQNPEALDVFLSQVSDPSSKNYLQFLSPQEYKAQFAAAPQTLTAAKNFFTSHGLTVTSSDNDSVTASGTAAAVQSAFGVQIHNFKVKGVVQRGNLNNPTVPDTFAASVDAVVGLSQHQMSPSHLFPHSPDGKQIGKQKVNAKSNGAFFPAQCIGPVKTVSFTTNGGKPKATYTGLTYGVPPGAGQTGSTSCGYQPSELYTAYGLNDVYAKGWKGDGQTIVIVDAFGSTTLRQDVALFDQIYGLPAINLQIIGTPVPATDANILGWATETTLDVEWAHAIAPHAKIVLEIAPDNFDTSLMAADQDAINKNLAHTFSHSFGAPESTESTDGIAAWEKVIKQAVAQGIAMNFSTGDDGDFQIDLGVGLKDVSFPSSSPFVTAVGGTSLALTSSNHRRFETGWGNNATEITVGNQPLDPPAKLGFQFGAGGGPSHRFTRPSFQKGVTGPNRQQPDIGWLADPFTGVEIIFTDPTAG